MAGAEFDIDLLKKYIDAFEMFEILTNKRRLIASGRSSVLDDALVDHLSVFYVA